MFCLKCLVKSASHTVSEYEISVISETVKILMASWMFAPQIKGDYTYDSDTSPYHALSVSCELYFMVTYPFLASDMCQYM